MPSSPGPSILEDRPVIQPNKLGQFIALDGCPQFFKYEFDDEIAQERRNEKNWKEAFEPLSLLLAKEGRDFENNVVSKLEEHAHSVVDHSHIEDWEDSKLVLEHAFENASNLPSNSSPLLIAQPRFGMRIEAWPVVGDADIVAVWSTSDGIRIRILDIKAAHEEKTYQQVQVAIYSLLCRQFLNELDPEYEWEIEGGIIHRESELSGSEPTDFPIFSLHTRELDIRRILQRDGQFDELWERDPEAVRYQLAPKCYNCAYKESCFTDAIESEKPALLGLSRGEQETFANHGIDTFEDIAELAYPPNDPRPFNYENLTPTDRSSYEELVSEPGIGERLPEYVQEAQSLLSEIKPDHMYTPNTDSRTPWLLGSGSGELPEDDPPYDDDDLTIPRRSLIRCYLHVEWDHRRDRVVMLNGYVTASRFAKDNGNSPREVSKLVECIPEGGEAESIEADLLESFFSEVFEEIREVADGMEEIDPTNAYIHCYFYSQEEREAISDAIERHDSRDIISAARDLFGLRAAIDQAMVSIVQSEVRDRLALPVNNPGLLPVKEYLHPSEDFFAHSDWTYTRSDGREIDLNEAFRYRLFDFYVPYRETGSGITLYPEGEPDGFYPSRGRQGSHIPLEYVWAALGRMTEEWMEDVREEYSSYQSIEPFKWVDRDEKTTRLTREDVQALGIRLARCLAHVERGIEYRNGDNPKEPIDIERLESFTLGDNEIARSNIEYLQLEYSSQRQELLAHYGLPVEQRIRRGDSIPFVVRSAEETERGDLLVEGTLLYDQMFDDGDRVAGACRQKGSTDVTGGSWMVANELDRQGDPLGSTRPLDIERGPGLTIEELDIDDRYIRLSAIDTYLPRDKAFQRQHRNWTIDPSEEDERTQCFESDRLFILDPRSDDLTAQRSYNILQEPEHNFIHQSLESLASGEQTSPETNAFPQPAVSDFMNWLMSSYDPVPNESQRAFIRDSESQFSLLQGPPGTGKTSGALANAVLARVLAFAHQDQHCIGIVAGESNKAVDEVLGDLADVYTAYRDDPDTGTPLDQMQLVRLTGDTPSDPIPSVEYVDYHSDEAAMRSLINRLQDDAPEEQRTLPETESEPQEASLPHLLVFTTPARLYGFINSFDMQLEDTLSPVDWLESNASFFDLLAVDEASMMRLPSFLLCGAFLHDHAQVLIAGDHRQLPPVRQHDWEAERRRTVTELSPYLSTLDFFRALNGEDVLGLKSDSRIAGTAELPFFRLEQTYRCHTDVTGVLHRHIYEKDGINFRSEEVHQLHESTPSSEAAEVALDPDTPLTLIVHNDRSSQQSNMSEAIISSTLVSSVSPADETGIVTPHNAQRGLLSDMTESTEVDTVERYQGGERDCIIVSATASDPDFLNSEQDFILNPNRLNVAMSRMKRKLIVIASDAVFELMPPEIEKYERAGLWKGLYDELDVINSDPAWEGSLSDLRPTTPLDNETDPSFSIYTFQPEE